MDKPKTTPKDFFLWAGAVVSLYWSISSFIFLVFDYINYTFPDPLRYYSPDPYQSGVSYEMASLMVLFPVFLVLMWLIHRDINTDHTRRDVWVRRWALMLTLFVAAVTVIGDLIVVINSFLSGESLTAPFLLKVAVVFLIASVVFMHFIADYWGFWEKNPARARSIGYISAFTVFLTIGTPMQARLARIDAQKVSDLQNIQSQIVYYYQQKQKLPAALGDLNDSISNYSVPLDPQSGKAYGYEGGAATSFKLCADFNRDSGGRMQLDNPTMYGNPGGSPGDNWQHGNSKTCFLRTIDTQLYPPTNVPAKPVPVR
jgi:hypothetical protein